MIWLFDQVVQKGIISQDQMDKLLENSFINLTPEERKVKMQERLTEVVKSGKMTQEQADKLVEKMNNDKNNLHKGMRPNKGNKEDMKKLTPEERKAKMEERVKEAVKSGKMTQEQADKMLERKENGHEFRMKKSPEDDILKKGVEEGTITQAQADEIIKIINENRVK